MSESVNVLCMKWGQRYGADYVNVLARAVKHNLTRNYRFVCLTDNSTDIDKSVETFPLPTLPLPQAAIHHGGWLKLGVFQPRLYDLHGTTLFLDLDVIILQSLDPFFEYGQDLTIILDWLPPVQKLLRKRQTIGNSSVFLFRIGEHIKIFDTFISNPHHAFSNFRNEQRFLSFYAHTLKFWPSEWCQSYKRHCQRPFPLQYFLPPTLPPNAKIIVFHGHPKPQDILRRKLPSSWISSYWQKMSGTT